MAMASYASCKFPLVDEFKDYGEKNKVVGFIDSVLSGFGQIVLSDNPVTGLLVMLGIFLGAPSQLLAAVIAACAASATAFLIGVNADLVRHGLYTFSGAIVGLGISLWGYSVQPVYPQLLIYAAIGGIVSVVVTAAINAFLSKWEAPSLSVPYCVTLMMLIPALLLTGKMDPQIYSLPQVGQVTDAFTGLDVNTFFTSAVAGVGEICFQVGIPSGVDLVSAFCCAALGTGFAAVLGLPTDNILIGLYGYNAALVGMGLFGRAFRMSVGNAIFTAIMALFSVLLTAAMGVAFMPLGIPVAALPFAVIVIMCVIGREHLSRFVPETIEKALKEQEHSEKQAG